MGKNPKPSPFWLMSIIFCMSPPFLGERSVVCAVSPFLPPSGPKTKWTSSSSCLPATVILNLLIFKRERNWNLALSQAICFKIRTPSWQILHLLWANKWTRRPAVRIPPASVEISRLQEQWWVLELQRVTILSWISQREKNHGFESLKLDQLLQTAFYLQFSQSTYFVFFHQIRSLHLH